MFKLPFAETIQLVNRAAIFALAVQIWDFVYIYIYIYIYIYMAFTPPLCYICMEHMQHSDAVYLSRCTYAVYVARLPRAAITARWCVIRTWLFLSLYLSLSRSLSLPISHASCSIQFFLYA